MNIAIFASGSGTNAEQLILHFRNSKTNKISLVLSNKMDAPVLHRAQKLGVKTITFNKNEFYETNTVLDILESQQIDFIVLAGFLLLVPEKMVRKYERRIVNIHPALLPAYGGKGMYGMKVHEAVIMNNELESGITIHYVNEKFDDGAIIFQAKCKVEKSDTPLSLAEKVHLLEYEFFSKTIEQLLL